MHAFAFRVFLAGVALLASTAVGSAQFQVPNAANPIAFNAGVAGLAPNLAGLAGFAAMSSVNPALADSSLPGASSLSPFSGLGGSYPGLVNLGVANMGNLYGSSAVIHSFDQYMTANQQARFMREQVRQEKLNNRRRVLEQWLWERSNLPTGQDEFERNQLLQLRRSQVDPPITEILAGRSLNDLLADAQRRQGQGTKGQDVPLDQIHLAQINFVPAGGGAANAGLLKELQNQQRFRWPVALRGEEYDRLRDLLTSLVQDALKQTNTQGRPEAGTMQELNRVLEQFNTTLRGDLSARDLPPSAYNPARGFLNDLANAVRALAEPDAKKYLDQTYTAGGKTAADLVGDMTKKGLAFAPATSPNQQPAYLALHRALAAYDVSLNSNASLTTDRR